MIQRFLLVSLEPGSPCWLAVCMKQMLKTIPPSPRGCISVSNDCDFKPDLLKPMTCFWVADEQRVTFLHFESFFLLRMMNKIFKMLNMIQGRAYVIHKS